MRADATHNAIAAVWRLESARLVAGLLRISRDLDRAEELAQDALVAALEQWPTRGVPDNPGAWLMTTARNRAVDQVRRNRMVESKHQEIGRELENLQRNAGDPIEDFLDDPVGDDLLRLMFICCHPILATDARVALTLRLLGGLTTAEIARAFLAPESAIAQRIVRAKRTLSRAGLPFEVPRGADFTSRISSVLEVVYLIFNEGYAATSGEDWMRPALCDEAIRLGRILATVAPAQPEVHGLVALMELQASRFRARSGAGGRLVRLADQDRTLWDRTLIEQGLAALENAERLSGGRGPYTIQAAIAACHARAKSSDETDWARIAALYSELASVQPSPVVELNRAVAVSMAEGPEAALPLVDALASEPVLRDYHLLPGVRADLFFRLGRFPEAAAEFERAASLTQNEPERQSLLDRARQARARKSCP